MNIVVLCGGLSNERNVSITSGTDIAIALRERGHRVLLMDLYFGYTGPYTDPTELFTTEQIDKHLPVEEETPNLKAVAASRQQDNGSLIGDNVLEICRCADIVFLALHGEEGENGKLQAIFDVHGIHYTGSGYLGSALAMNKTLSKRLLDASGIRTPAGIALRRGEALPEISLPCVVKPCSGGSSVGTSIVREQADLARALDEAFAYEDSVLVERYIKGRELTVGVIDHRAMPVIEIIPKDGFYDYKNKYQPGCTLELCPAPLSGEDTASLQALAVRAAEALMIDAYCRVDFIMDDAGDIYCLEANSLPGMTPTSLIPQMAGEEGMSYGQLCEKLIEVSLEKYR